MRWVSYNSTSCSISNTSWTGTSGCQDGGSGGNQTYTLSCSGNGGNNPSVDTATVQCSANYNNVCTTATNACGMFNSGRIQCDGSCNVTTPPSNSSCPVPNITMGGTYISPCTITWSATQVTSCTLVGPGVNTSGTSGSVQTPLSSVQNNYILTCYNGPDVYTSRSRVCSPNPSFEEF